MWNNNNQYLKYDRNLELRRVSMYGNPPYIDTAKFINDKV